MQFLAILRAFLACISICTCLAVDCNYTLHHEKSELKGNAEIQALKGHRYTVSDSLYTYNIGICMPASDDPSYANVGVTQTSKGKEDKKTTIVGNFSDADIVAGTNWVMLTYNGGKAYTTHCKGADGSNPEHRRAKIMFVCDQTSTDIGAIQPMISEEQNEKDEGCYYLFEINTAEICKKVPLVTLGLSTGSVLLIVFLCVTAFYILAGVLYKRFVLHAKGLEQIPNIGFWQDFGNLEADGCDLVCRSSKSRLPREYKGIGDEQLGEADMAPDDGLLPM